MPPTPPADERERPYHAKRPHRKSRLGCRNCKTRKVKCDEKKPSCRNCTLRKETCNYPPQTYTQTETQTQSHSDAKQPAAPRTTALGPSASLVSQSASASSSALPAADITAAQTSSSPAPISAAHVDPLRVALTPVSPSVSSASPLSHGGIVSPATSTSRLLLQQSPPWGSKRTSHRRAAHYAASLSAADDEEAVVEVILYNEPPFKFGGADEYDMKLLWFYTTETYASFSVEAGKLPSHDRIMKSHLVTFAFQSSFLMDSILGLSALHMQSLNMPIPPSKAITYRARAFAGYRQAIEKGDPKDFGALLACSLLMCALSSEIFREADMKPLYVIDWMIVWRGIGLIFDLLPTDALFDTGLQALFVRPSFNLNQEALYIPSNLLFMITSIKEGDPDHPHVEHYYETLKFLGGLYRELENGFSPLLSMRIVTWFTFLPKPFVELVRNRQPRTLVILAHYLSFLKLVQNCWWLDGVADRGIQDIIDHLDPEWQATVSVPRMVMQLQNKVELAKLIKGNHAWEPSTEKAAALPEMAMVNDQGEQVAWDKEKGWIPLFPDKAQWHDVQLRESQTFSPTTPSNPRSPED